MGTCHTAAGTVPLLTCAAWQRPQSTCGASTSGESLQDPTKVSRDLMRSARSCEILARFIKYHRKLVMLLC